MSYLITFNGESIIGVISGVAVAEIKMKKKEITIPGGRKLIYYSFEKQDKAEKK